MKFSIIGGSFGESGSMTLGSDIVINSARSAAYSVSDVTDIHTTKGANIKKTSILSVLIGIVLTVILTIAFNIIGFVIGLLLTIVGSTYTTKGKSQANLEFSDGKKVVVEGNKRKINSLVQAVPN